MVAWYEGDQPETFWYDLEVHVYHEYKVITFVGNRTKHAIHWYGPFFKCVTHCLHLL